MNAGNLAASAHPQRLQVPEEFADNLEHPDPVPLRLLPRGREPGALGPEDSNGESGCAQVHGVEIRRVMVMRCRGKGSRHRQSQLSLPGRLIRRHVDGRKG